MANHLHPLKRSKKKTLVGVEFERVGHKSGCVRDHAVGRRNRVALNSQISSHPVAPLARTAPNGCEPSASIKAPYHVDWEIKAAQYRNRSTQESRPRRRRLVRGVIRAITISLTGETVP